MNTEYERMKWQLLYALESPNTAEMKEVVWQALHGCTGAEDVDAVRERWGTWEMRMERKSRLLTMRCAVGGHEWTVTHTNKWMIPTREQCSACGTIRKWSGGPPPAGRWDVLPPMPHREEVEAKGDGMNTTTNEVLLEIRKRAGYVTHKWLDAKPGRRDILRRLAYAGRVKVGRSYPMFIPVRDVQHGV